MTLTKEHQRFKEFLELLDGNQGIYFREENGDHIHDCRGDHFFTKNILWKHFPEINVEDTLEYFCKLGGFCDCEIFMNIVCGDLAEQPRNW